MPASFRLAGVLIAVATLAGCRARPEPQPEAAPSTEISAEGIQSIRDTYLRINPNARVGRVIEVKPDTRMAAVGDVKVSDFRRGDPITFINAKQDILANGRVVVLDTFVIVEYEAPTKPGQRAPQPGDLAVRAQ